MCLSFDTPLICLVHAYQIERLNKSLYLIGSLIFYG